MAGERGYLVGVFAFCASTVAIAAIVFVLDTLGLGHLILQHPNGPVNNIGFALWVLMMATIAIYGTREYWFCPTMGGNL